MPIPWWDDRCVPGCSSSTARRHGCAGPAIFLPREEGAAAVTLPGQGREEEEEEVALSGQGTDDEQIDDEAVLLWIEQLDDVELPGSIHEAAVGAEALAIQTLIDASTHVNERDEAGDTLLGLASGRGDARVVKMLLDKGAQVGARNFLSNPPLHAAAQAGALACVEALLAAGADPGAEGENQAGALHVAARLGHRDVAVALLRAGASATATDAFGATSLHGAAENGHASVVATLIQHGADPAAIDEDETTPLHLCSERGDMPCVELLLQAGAEQMPDELGDRPAIGAAERGHVEVVRRLLEAGPCAEDLSGACLHRAASAGQLPVVLALLEMGANPAWSESGRTPLMVAALRGHVDVAQALIRLPGAHPRAACLERVGGQTAIHLAAESQPGAGVLRSLLDAGAGGPHAGDSSGAGAWFDIPGKGPGQTPLMAAADRGRVDAVALLLLHGAAPHPPGSARPFWSCHRLADALRARLPASGGGGAGEEEEEGRAVGWLLGGAPGPGRGCGDEIGAAGDGDDIGLVRGPCEWSPDVHLLYPLRFRRAVSAFLRCCCSRRQDGAEGARLDALPQAVQLLVCRHAAPGPRVGGAGVEPWDPWL